MFAEVAHVAHKTPTGYWKRELRDPYLSPVGIAGPIWGADGVCTDDYPGQ